MVGRAAVRILLPPTPSAPGDRELFTRAGKVQKKGFGFAVLPSNQYEIILIRPHVSALI